MGGTKIQFITRYGLLYTKIPLWNPVYWFLGWRQQDGWEVDHPPEERPGVALLGEPDPGHARGAVHGWRGDLWGRSVSTLPGKPPNRHGSVAPSHALLHFTHICFLCFFLQEDIISIWNKTASDQSTTARIRDTLRRVLNLPPNTIMEYKTHTDSIKYVCLIVLLFSLPFSLTNRSIHAHKIQISVGNYLL